MSDILNISYVLDGEGKPLSPTKEMKAWYMIRKGKAKLVSKYPMTIQLIRIIPKEDICKDEVRMGIDDGSLHVGIAVVQKGKKKNKVLLKGTIEERNDVKKLMETRRGYRRNRRSNKRHREKRFDNRTSKHRSSIAPTIKQNKQATIRVIDTINKIIPVTKYYLEDVKIDIRALEDGYKPYKWEYQKSNRLDENIRKAIIIRDNNTCKMCGKKKGVMEVHHILPKRLSGTDSIDNLITLCHKCHKKVTGRETKYIKYFNKILDNEDVDINKKLNHASHVMIGKKYLQDNLKDRGNLFLTTGGDTDNKRYDWHIEKTHSNDAICITGLKPDNTNIKDWSIKPIRRQSKAKTKNVLGFKHKDYVEYTYKNGETHKGYVTALYPDIKALNFQSKTKHCKKVNAKKCKLLWSFNKIMWL